MLHYYINRIKPIFFLFMAVQFIIRLIFTIYELPHLEYVNILKSFGMGIVFDISTFSLLILPYVLYLLCLPRGWHHGKFDRIFTHILMIAYIFGFIFDIGAEYTFWQEFAVRFNFIAVDYLVYADEVLGNIMESYPMGLIITAIVIVVAIIYFAIRRTFIPKLSVPVLSQKLTALGIFIAVTGGLYVSLSNEHKEITDNNYANEITSNGIYSLFSAFKNNALEYDKFYLTYHDVTKQDLPDYKPYITQSNNPEHNKNVIFIMMESMGADFMKTYGNPKDLTPTLDGLTGKSLNFSRLYATGTRTVTGLEALSLSIPPSPGKSIVKRQNNEHLASLGYVFKDKGYDTKFIYGGFGYFDNMNYFFENNGFDIVDRNSMTSDEVGFANIWGVADEYLFNRTIREASKTYQKNQPFMYMVMTTSNHRPYTFPKNPVGIPESGGGRDAGVRYADYAIGKFLSDAQKQAWFKDTVFVIVADHTAGASGKTSLPPVRYHIPAMIYAPDFIKPQDVNKIASQIDLPVTLLDVLGFDYHSKFFGKNILDKDFVQRAFLTTNQKLGIYQNNSVTFIEPVKSFGAESEQGEILDKTISIDSPILKNVILHYQTASSWNTIYQKFPTTLIKSNESKPN